MNDRDANKRHFELCYEAGRLAPPEDPMNVTDLVEEPETTVA